jgi:hypothetical protein
MVVRLRAKKQKKYAGGLIKPTVACSGGGEFCIRKYSTFSGRVIGLVPLRPEFNPK